MFSTEREEFQDKIRRLELDLHHRSEELASHSREIARLKAEGNEVERRLLGEAGRSEKLEGLLQEAERVRDNLFSELQELKDAMARTIIKLPGGNEASLSEAVGMVKVNEVIQGG